VRENLLEGVQKLSSGTDRKESEGTINVLLQLILRVAHRVSVGRQTKEAAMPTMRAKVPRSMKAEGKMKMGVEGLTIV